MKGGGGGGNTRDYQRYSPSPYELARLPSLPAPALPAPALPPPVPPPAYQLNSAVNRSGEATARVDTARSRYTYRALSLSLECRAHAATSRECRGRRIELVTQEV